MAYDHHFDGEIKLVESSIFFCLYCTISRFNLTETKILFHLERNYSKTIQNFFGPKFVISIVLAELPDGASHRSHPKNIFTHLHLHSGSLQTTAGYTRALNQKLEELFQAKSKMHVNSTSTAHT